MHCYLSLPLLVPVRDTLVSGDAVNWFSLGLSLFTGVLSWILIKGESRRREEERD